MNEKTLRHFTFHSKNEIHILIEYVKNAGVKDGKKLSVSDKMMLYLMRLRINCPSKTLGFFFDIHESTVQKTFTEIETALCDFVKEFGTCTSAAQIIEEHTTLYTTLVYGSDTLVLCLDGTYFYRNSDLTL